MAQKQTIDEYCRRARSAVFDVGAIYPITPFTDGGNL